MNGRLLSCVVVLFLALTARADDKEEKAARKLAAKKALKELKQASDVRQRAGFVATDFFEWKLGLSEGALSMLKALPDVGPRACSAFVQAGVTESMAEAIEKRCKLAPDALVVQVQRVDHAKQTKTLMAACKLKQAPAKDVTLFEPWSLLLSTLLADHLALDHNSNKDEQALAKMVAYVCDPTASR